MPGPSWQKDRTWCVTGVAVRRRKKDGVVTVTDPDADAKKSLIERRLTTQGPLARDWPSGAPTRPAPSRRCRRRATTGGRKAGAPPSPTNTCVPEHQDPDPVPPRHGAGPPPTGDQQPEHGPAWLAEGGVGAIVATLPALATPLDPAANRALWQAWQDELAVRFSLPEDLPPLRILLVWDNLAGHKTAEMVV